MKRFCYQDMEKENEFDLVVEAVGGYGTETVMTNASKIVKPVRMYPHARRQRTEDQHQYPGMDGKGDHDPDQPPLHL